MSRPFQYAQILDQVAAPAGAATGTTAVTDNTCSTTAAAAPAATTVSGYTAAIRHFDRLFSRYGGHVTALSLVRTRHSTREVRASLTSLSHVSLSPTSRSAALHREVRACVHACRSYRWPGLAWPGDTPLLSGLPSLPPRAQTAATAMRHSLGLSMLLPHPTPSLT